MSPVDWCPNDGTLAREQVEGADRHCWRCGAKVEKRELDAVVPADHRTTPTSCWTSRGIDWPDPIRIMQTNWIGRSTGAEIVFETAPSPHHAGGEELRVFTTRPDTLFGATFMVLAPEHPLVATLTAPERRDEVEAYVAGDRRRRPRSTGCRPTARRPASPIGADAINPVNGERIPIFVADYVLGGYGTGAIMAVPAHDERDFAFAQAVRAADRQGRACPRAPIRTRSLEAAFVEHTVDEVMVNSGRFTRPPGGRRPGTRSSAGWRSRARARPR